MFIWNIDYLIILEIILVTDMHTLPIPLVSLLFEKVVGEGKGHLIQEVGTLFL